MLKTWKNEVHTYFKKLSSNLRGRTEKNREIVVRLAGTGDLPNTQQELYVSFRSLDDVLNITFKFGNEDDQDGDDNDDDDPFRHAPQQM